MVKGGCIGIGWGSRLQQSVLNSPSNELHAQSLEKLTVETQPSVAGSKIQQNLMKINIKIRECLVADLLVDNL